MGRSAAVVLAGLVVAVAAAFVAVATCAKEEGTPSPGAVGSTATPAHRDPARRAEAPRQGTGTPHAETGTAAPAAAPAADAPVAVRVVVLTEEDRKPVAGAEVHVVDSDFESDEQTATTDAAGTATVTRTPGRFAARATAEGFVRSEWEGGEAPAGKGGSVEIVVGKGVLLDGLVLDAVSGRPLAGARVVVEPGGSIDNMSSSSSEAPFGTATTDADGRFRVVVDAGEMATPMISARGHVPFSKTVIVPAGDAPRAPVEFRLEAAGRVTGTVKDPDGHVVAGAKVYAVPADEAMLVDNPDLSVSGGGRTRTATRSRADDRGVYELDGLAFGGAYRILARGEGWAMSAPSETVTTKPEAPSSIVDMTLRRHGTIVLRLVDPEGHGVAARATHSRGEWLDMDQIDASGVLRLERREPGRYRIDVTPPGFVVVHLEIDLAEGAVVEKTVTLDRGVAAAGRVVDDRGEAIEGATVHLRRPFEHGPATLPPSEGEVKSGQDGTFRVAGLLPGPHIVSAYASAGHSMTEDAPIEVPAEGVRVVMVRQTKVKFRLTVPAGTTPPAQVYLSLGHLAPFSTATQEYWGGNASTEDFGKGSFERDFDAGTSRLRVLAAGFSPAVRRFEARPGEPLDLGEIRLDAGLSLTGRVEDLAGGPVAGARVTCGESLTPEYQSVASGRDGSFRLEHLEAGKIEVSVDASGFLQATEKLDVAAGGAAATVRLARGAALKISVVDAEGHAVPGAAITVRKADAAKDEDPVVAEDADHRGVLETRVPAGRWRVVAEGRDASAECETKEGGAAEVRVVLK
jgi:protocatechuate 3,4-dioxygenase beta subunit